ncbi:hypothetical protein GTQ34_09920 [Muricauda sp. JGD-17]|uniref:Uncharacterized protein n=1 Tax=Flagellimonas ochracea TaxID=2696472 RepID=A0A964TEW5_9FLAO|nr:hypothetical protein [Allomuricauda ochracea]NAY92236.1 hypothetical protein [Allomuricauda ochracea]
MTYRNYLMIVFATAVLGFTANANDISTSTKELDVQSIEFIEEDHSYELGFDTSKYLPEGFDPYQGQFSVSSINYMDLCEEIELGFETTEYLPEDFNPYAE